MRFQGDRRASPFSVLLRLYAHREDVVAELYEVRAADESARSQRRRGSTLPGIGPPAVRALQLTPHPTPPPPRPCAPCVQYYDFDPDEFRFYTMQLANFLIRGNSLRAQQVRAAAAGPAPLSCTAWRASALWASAHAPPSPRHPPCAPPRAARVLPPRQVRAVALFRPQVGAPRAPGLRIHRCPSLSLRLTRHLLPLCCCASPGCAARRLYFFLRSFAPAEGAAYSSVM